MSIRSEIRAALVDGPKTTDELLPLVPTAAGDRAKLQQCLSELAGDGRLRRTGLDDNKRPIYTIDEWPTEALRGVAVKESLTPGTRKRKAATKPPAKTRPAKPARKAAPAKASRPARTSRPARRTKSPTALALVPADPNALQVGGSHYQELNPQPWDVISAWGLDFILGNVIKYVARAPAKGGIEDLHKARHYLDKAIALRAA